MLYEGQNYDFRSDDSLILCALFEALTRSNNPKAKVVVAEMIQAQQAADPVAIRKCIKKMAVMVHPDRFNRELGATFALNELRLKHNIQMGDKEITNRACRALNHDWYGFTSASQDLPRPFEAIDAQQILSFFKDLSASKEELMQRMQETILGKITNSDPIFDDVKVSPKLYADSEAGFANLITGLEQMRTPIAHLNCALLLSKQINCFWDDKDGDDLFGEEYFIKRFSDAINFYMLAAKDPSLLPVVKTMLSFIKADMDILTEGGYLSAKQGSFIEFLKICCNKLEARPVMLRSYQAFKDTSKLDLFARLYMQVYINHEESATEPTRAVAQEELSIVKWAPNSKFNL